VQRGNSPLLTTRHGICLCGFAQIETSAKKHPASSPKRQLAGRKLFRGPSRKACDKKHKLVLACIAP
jgi:hypothetical protein